MIQLINAMNAQQIFVNQQSIPQHMQHRQNHSVEESKDYDDGDMLDTVDDEETDIVLGLPNK